MSVEIDHIEQLVTDMLAERRVRLTALQGRSRAAKVVRARIAIAKKLRSKDIKLVEIGHWLNRHHSTIVYYLVQRPTRLARYAAKKEARYGKDQGRGVQVCDPAGNSGED